jgi:hypothetical protein
VKLIIANKVKALTDFAAQIVFGSMDFAVVFVAALLLSLLIRWGSRVKSAPGWLDTSAGLVEMAVWGADIFVFALFILSEVIKSMRTFWREWSKPNG